jgi:CCR4-NOT transcription complex subunit 3
MRETRRQEDGYEEDEGIYDDLNLDEQEELFGINGDNDDVADSASESASESE